MGKSFYGGMDGRPFILRKSFLTVSEMITEFKKGHNYKEVNYGEYVIINTVNKNNPENGRIFRRAIDSGTTQNIETWDLTESKNIFKKTIKQFNGAVYIGQIVGPSGNAPHFISLPTHLPQLDEEGKYKYDDNNNLLYEEELSDYEKVLQRYTAYDTRSGEGVFSIENTHLIPGKEGEAFNDNITWQYCSVRDENEQETNAYIGFTFPYMIVEWDASSVNPYYNRDKDNISEFKNLNLVDREDDTFHPFYQKWKINVPKGIHGQSIENLRIVDEGTEEEPKKVLKYDLRNYDTQQEGEVSTHLIGDYNMINRIQLSNTGFLDIDTTTSQNEIHQQLHWIKDISTNGNTGVVTYTDIDGTPTTEQLNWVKKVEFDENGTVTVKYTDPVKEDDIYENLIDWIKSIKIAQDGTVTVVSNNNAQLLDSTQEKLKWVNGVSLSQDGTFIQSYNNGETTPQQTERLKWPINIQLNSEDGTVTTTYNDGSVNTTQNPQMDWIKSVKFNDDDKLLQIDYVRAEDISVNLKTPNQIELTESGDFYATYNTGERILLGNIGELNPISATAIAEGEEEPANLMAGGILFITQDATTEE